MSTYSIHPVAHILCKCPNRIMQRHRTPQWRISHQSARGLLEKIQKRSKNGCVKLNDLHLHRGCPLHFFHCRAASTVIPLLPKATYTSSIQPNLGLPRTLTSAINSLPSSHTVLIHSPHVSKPSEFSMIHSTPFLFQLSTHLFIRNSINW